MKSRFKLKKERKKQKKNLIKWYESTAEKYDSWDDKENYSEEMETIEKLLDIKKDEKLLDVATGTGNYLIMAAKKGAICYGIDITPKIIKVAQEKVKKLGIQNVRQIKIGDAQNLDYEDNFFDWVLCIGMLEYYSLEVAEKILREFKRVLKKDGKLLVDFPDFRNPKAYEFKRKSESVNTDVFIYKTNIVEQMIKVVGFDIILTKRAGIEVQFLIQKVK